MRFRAGLLLFLLAILLGFGCRKPLTPNVDRNQAPETWITAAPQDTITIKDPIRGPIKPQVGTIPFRFHLYWAGSDRDGAVAGFYWAVVETLPIAPAGLPDVPPLPGPKPGDYHFTAKTDSIFIFNVSEFSPDRRHAFFIYSVDDKGKGDATPARLTFNAIDRFPPRPIIELPDLSAIPPYYGGAVGTGLIARMSTSGVVITDTMRVGISDSLKKDNSNFAIPTKDTIPATARIDITWRAEPRIAGTYVTGYRYKLDEPQFVVVDSSVHIVSYGTGVGGDEVRPGPKLFTLKAVDQAGGADNINRRFQMNFRPDTWFSGPDLSHYPIRAIQVPNWSNLAGQPGSLLSCDSLFKLPPQRPERKTFFEIYKDTLYVHAEGDTVNMNSWVVLHAGGSDLDSPYDVIITPQDPDIGPDTLACGPAPAGVFHKRGIIGSPIGFKFQFTGYAWPTGPASTASQSVLFPNFDVSSVFRSPVVAGYLEMRRASKVYAVLRGQDSNGAADNRINNARNLVEKVDAGMGMPEEIALRSKVMTFYVDKPARLLPAATPFPGQEFPTRRLTFDMAASDADPYDLYTAPSRTGGPSAATILRWFVRVRGKTAAGGDTAFVPFAAPFFNQSVVFDVPSFISSEDLTVEIELCDCDKCLESPGDGRCVTYSIPIIARNAASTSSPTSENAGSQPGPGRTQAVRSLKP